MKLNIRIATHARQEAALGGRFLSARTPLIHFRGAGSLVPGRITVPPLRSAACAVAPATATGPGAQPGSVPEGMAGRHPRFFEQ
jgi:hypothetical protein